jgi:hypothetical protein
MVDEQAKYAWKPSDLEPVDASEPNHLPEIATLLARLKLAPPKSSAYGWLRNGGLARLHAAGVKIQPYTRYNADAILLAGLRVHFASLAKKS